MKITIILSLIMLPFLGLCGPKIDSLELALKTYKEDTSKVNALIRISNALYESNSFNEAIYYSMQAKELSAQIGFKTGLAESFRRIGAIYTTQGRYSDAMKYILQAMNIYQSEKNGYGIFMTNNSLGTVYYYLGDYDKALFCYLKSNAFKSNDAMTCSNIGIAYLCQGKYTMALYFFKKSLAYYQCTSNNKGISSMLNNIGAVYEDQNKNDSALIYYTKALDTKKMLGDNQGICDELGGIGDVFFKQKKYKQSLQYELQSLTLAKKIGYLNSIKQTEEIVSDIYQKIGKPDSALLHYKLFILARDSMFNEENTRQTVVAEKDFEFRKKEENSKMEQAKKDAIQNEKLKSQSFKINLFIAVLILIAFFLVIVFRGYKKIQLAKKIIEKQKKILEEKNKEVTDNINYAQRIQLAMLPSEDYINTHFPDNFILYRPKDIISGDFYWAYSDGKNKYFATADCTGHGVSGAMMSMIGASLLNEIVIERNITSPELVLDALRDEIIKALNKQGASEERKDGMDISFCKITNNTLEAAAANSPIYIIRNGDFIEIKADRFPVGKHINNIPFTLNTIELIKGDVVFTMSDGFCDQFGDSGKKIMSKRFKQWAVELSGIQDMHEMKKELELRFNTWMGNSEQIDDVTVFAIKI